MEEISSVEKMNGGNFMRLIRPLRTDESCLKCYAKQGYRVGDIRGGISVSHKTKKEWVEQRIFGAWLKKLIKQDLKYAPSNC
jgi:hypothetical protein